MPPHWPSPVLTSLRLHAVGSRLYDTLGRQVLLRGANAGSRAKLPPFFPFDFNAHGPASETAFAAACATYLDAVAALGLNFLRVPFTWEAVEPERGRFDEAYLGRLDGLVEMAAARGLRVMLDAHQDLFARAYGGDGFPSWALSRPDASRPWYGKILWGIGYGLDANVRRDFKRFWRNDAGIQEAFIAMWHMLAARFGRQHNIVALEILNEPDSGGGNHARWNADTLTAFHERAGQRMREAAADCLIAFGVSGRDGLRGTTATHKPSGDRWIFAPHVYDAPRMAFALAGAHRLSDVFGATSLERSIARWAALGEAWTLPVVVGEFGVPRAAAGSAWHLRQIYESLDRHLLSGAVWECSMAEEDWNHEGMSILLPGGEPTALSLEVARPFPAAIAGELASFTWNASSRRGELCFIAVAHQTSEVAYPSDDSVELSFSPGTPTQWRREGQRLLIHTEAAGKVTVAFGAPAVV